MTEEQDVTQKTPEAEVKTPESEEHKPQVTAEELQKQLTELQETSQKNEENWKTAQRDGSKKQTEIQRLREQLQSNDSQSDMMKALVAMMAQNQNKTSDELTEEIKQQQPDLLKQFEQIQQASERKREIDRATNRIKAIQERTEALGIKGEDYKVIRAFAQAGEYDDAESRLEQLETATKPPEEPEESEDDRVKRLATEKFEAMVKERGLLTQDPGIPSASSGTITKEILERRRSEPGFRKWFAENEEEIDKLHGEGRL